MKQLLKLFIVIMIASVSFTGCEKDITSEDDSRITNYVAFELEGLNDNGETLVELGSNYTDPGYTATEGEQDVTSEVEVTGTVDATEVGSYPVSYSAVNKDGFSASASRTVLVYDPSAPSDDLTGTWSGTVTRYTSSVTGPYNVDIEISKIENGFFSISDWIGGFYDQGYEYGSAYASPGYFSIDSEYGIHFEGETRQAFGIGVAAIENATVDPEANTLSMDITWNGTWIFEIRLSKN